MKLDLSALRDAIAALEKSLGYLRSELAADPNLREQFRAASIQGFEFTYDVAYKMIKRQLEQIAANPSDVDAMTYPPRRSPRLPTTSTSPTCRSRSISSNGMACPTPSGRPFDGTA
jgi:hypothetical protein